MEKLVDVRVLRDGFKVDGQQKNVGEVLVGVLLSAAMAWVKHEAVELLEKLEDKMDEKRQRAKDKKEAEEKEEVVAEKGE